MNRSCAIALAARHPAIAEDELRILAERSRQALAEARRMLTWGFASDVLPSRSWKPCWRPTWAARTTPGAACEAADPSYGRTATRPR